MRIAQFLVIAAAAICGCSREPNHTESGLRARQSKLLPGLRVAADSRRGDAYRSTARVLVHQEPLRERSRKRLMIEGNIAAIRVAATFADVQTTGRVIAVKEYVDGLVEPGEFFRNRWAALIRDSSGEIPIFGFGKPPPIDSWIVVWGNVGGFTQEALEDSTFVARLVAERGWVDSAEIGVTGWHFVESGQEEV